jgi:ABC-type polysaccharide/polyol phosphate export permease
MFRTPIVHGAWPAWTTFVPALVTVVLLAASAAAVLRALQRRLIFYL